MKFKIRIALLSFLFCTKGIPQAFSTEAIDVSRGLPQSYISGIVQDPQGFLWFATRDGLARYDGISFKVFRNTGNERVRLPSNIINMIHMDTDGIIWIKYDQGTVDILDTNTGKFTNIISKGKNDITSNKIKNTSPIARDAQGNHWLLDNNNDGVYVVDTAKRIRYIHRSTLLPGIRDSKLMGISESDGKVILVTDRALVYMTAEITPGKIIPFTFQNASLFKTKRPWKDNSPLIRKNGEVIICDEGRIIIYCPNKDRFSIVKLPHQDMYVAPPRFLDATGMMYFAFNGEVYTLSNDNILKNTGMYKSADQGFQIISMLKDKSGVMWLGSNGFGLVKADLELPRMQGLSLTTNFQDEVLRRLNVNTDIRNNGLFKNLKTNMFRWIKDGKGRIWMTSAKVVADTRPDLYCYDSGKLIRPTWHYRQQTNTSAVSAMAFDSTGKLWGIDQMLRPVLFETGNFTVDVLPPLQDVASFKRTLEINKLFIEGDDFLILTNLGMLKYNRVSGSRVVMLPDKHLLTAIRVGDLLWIGSYSDGLIEYHMTTGKIRYHTIETGLPNNTVYAIIRDKTGLLWCSSNKGIFSYDTKTRKVTSYTTKDGLPGDEFNRFAYFEFPDGTMAFGTTKDYTVFNPVLLKADNFKPEVAITGIRINNKPADYYDEVPMIRQPVNNLDLLELTFEQNFLMFEFAALQYNIPEKIKYRYQLSGLDENWVMSDHDHTATYTTIPPGKYIFMVNASNTSGTWSPFVKKISIVIKPPFWQTWWFIALSILALAGLVSFAVLARFKSVRASDRRKISFERETMELEARALRSQMNPHFIFNCLNSIKALIHRDKKQEAIMYLAKFSKLTRSQLNSNLKETTLADELNTCTLYLELESLRFGNKLRYSFDIDEAVDLNSLKVPPLLIQPFIENSIVHGILPKEQGGEIIISVKKHESNVYCRIDDDGIGRVSSMKLNQDRNHISRGLGLAQERLALYDKLDLANSQIVITDKIENNIPRGTLVTIIFSTDDQSNYYR